MLRKIALVLFYVYFSDNFQGNFAKKFQVPPSACEVFSNSSGPLNTPSPIDIKSKEAITVYTNSSLIIVNGIFDPLTVVNTGYAVEAYGYRFEGFTAQTYGGILCGKKFIFHKVVFYASGDPKLSSFTKIDGKGSPMTLSIYFINVECASLNECLQRRDGFVIQNYQIGFSPFDNPLFYPLQYVLKFLRKPGSKITVPAIVVYAGFNKLPTINGYYVNYGSYIDLKTGKQYPCAIEIASARPVFPISKDQFRAFTQLRNIKGKSLDSRRATQKSNGRKVFFTTKVGGKFKIL